jgi:hypothetical protein
MSLLFIIGILLSSPERNLPFLFGGRFSTGYQDYRFENQRGDFYILIEPYIKFERIKKFGISVSGDGMFYRYFITENMRFVGNSDVHVQYNFKEITFITGDSLSTLSKDITKPDELFSELVMRNSLYSEISTRKNLSRRISFTGSIRGGYNILFYEDIDYPFGIFNGEVEGYMTKRIRGGGGLEVKYFGIEDWMRFSPFCFIRIFLFRLKTEIRGGYNFLSKGEREGFMGRIFVQYSAGRNEISGSLYRTSGEDFMGKRYITEGGGFSIIWRLGRKIRVGGDASLYRVKYEGEEDKGYISTGLNAGYTLKSFELFSACRFFHPFEGNDFSDVRAGITYNLR